MFQVAPSDPSLPTFHLIYLCPNVIPEPQTQGPSCGKRDGPVIRPRSSPRASLPCLPSHGRPQHPQGHIGSDSCKQQVDQMFQDWPWAGSQSRWGLILRCLGAPGGPLPCGGSAGSPPVRHCLGASASPSIPTVHLLLPPLTLAHRSPKYNSPSWK